MWLVKCDMRTVERRVSSRDCGVWTVKCGVCYDVWSVESKAYNVKCIRCGVWSVASVPGVGWRV